MLRITIVSVFTALLCACGVGQDTSVEQTATVSQPLVLASRPVELANWRWGTPFIRNTARSAYVVGVQDPYDASSFLAWGFDVRTEQALFFVHGSRALFPRFQAQLDADLGGWAVGSIFDPSFSWGLAMQINKPPPPPPPGGIDWVTWSGYAWKKSLALHQTATTFGP